MSKLLYAILVLAVLSACSKEAPEGSSAGSEPVEEGVEGAINGPFPKTIRGTIGHSYPLEDESGNIYLGLLEYESAGIIVSPETYDAKGMAEDDAEVSLSIEPTSPEQCGDVAQCFKGY